MLEFDITGDAADRASIGRSQQGRHHGAAARGGTSGAGWTRRRWLSAGSLATLGLSWSSLLARRAAAGPSPESPRATAKACLQLFLWGGPSAQETWDPKPTAPEATRSQFDAIATRTPGMAIVEHLPLLAQRSDRYTIVRSLTHTGVNHGTSAYHMLTGHLHWSPGTLRHPTKKDMPNLAASAAPLLEHAPHLPGCVSLPSVVNDGDGLPVPGQGAGMLGDAYAPFLVEGDPTADDFRVDALGLAEGVSRQRLARRVSLRQTIDERLEHLSRSSDGQALSEWNQQAWNLLASRETEAAFDLASEPATLRERYGRHHFGQSLVLARRLIEAGVPLVTVYWNSPRNTDDESWDTHVDQPRRMKEHLLPALDRALSALLDDLAERNLLETTLVTWFGEFGRTPLINRHAGRDHWGFCQSIGLAGGGVPGGACYGASTRDGGYAEREPVTPDDLAATLLTALGIDPRIERHDRSGRPVPLSYGTAVGELLSA